MPRSGQKYCYTNAVLSIAPKGWNRSGEKKGVRMDTMCPTADVHISAHLKNDEPLAERNVRAGYKHPAPTVKATMCKVKSVLLITKRPLRGSEKY